jgi:hypothetical protein
MAPNDEDESAEMLALFELAAAAVRSLPRFSFTALPKDSERLMLYGLYKQAVAGERRKSQGRRVRERREGRRERGGGVWTGTAQKMIKRRERRERERVLQERGIEPFLLFLTDVITADAF